MSEVGLKEIEKKVSGESASSDKAGFLRRIPWSSIGMPAVLVILCVSFGTINPNFWSVMNVTNVSRQISILALISIGQTFAILSAGIDLSVGSLLALVSVVCAQQMLNFGLWGGIAAGILVGALAGLINGLLIAKAKLPAFIATLAHVDYGSRRCTNPERRIADCRLASRVYVSRRGQDRSDPGPGSDCGRSAPYCAPHTEANALWALRLRHGQQRRSCHAVWH